MGSSLALIQALRLLKNGEFKSKFCMSYWIGQILADVIPEMDLGLMEVGVPPYYQHLAVLISDAKIAELFTSSNWKGLINRTVYQHHVSLLEAPKVELEHGSSMSRAWKRLFLPSLSAESQEILYLMLHNKLPVKERLHRIGVARDPYCDQCLADGAVNPICDTEHFFCLCIKVAESWRGIKEIICNLLQEKPNDADLLTLIFP